jgi:hypothetical protein
MGLLRRMRGKPKPEAAEDRSEEEAVREVGEPDPAKVTVARAPDGRVREPEADVGATQKSGRPAPRRERAGLGVLAPNCEWFRLLVGGHVRRIPGGYGWACEFCELPELPSLG